ncbi:hypothetical protein LWI29_015165 [Acer saccharum]|uniref:Reverse transcriptase domain-containing protein n=1 Tax=Acer saccharum TaxID=4024 RepID=A0AA39TRP5_ACESA|nr:hypothetical protein LWI29_015165 [Acer saccharum]
MISLHGLFDGNGVWKTNEGEMAGIISQYFSSIFTSSHPSAEQLERVLGSVEHRLPSNMRDFLDGNFSAEEVKEALFQMSPSKSPGEDGFPAAFFQKHWEVVGGEVTRLCLECLNDGLSVRMINHTILCLIPKVKKVENMVDLRPISLCNVIYKCISKARANRLRKVLNFVISDSQSAFLPGRLITDNAMIGFECMHALRRKVNGKKKGFMSLKLDMSKAYDRVDWNFLKGMMLRLGFSERWVSKIMGCVSSVSYSFILNGKIRGHISPSRGLRQGDPLSPYLFLICAEGLSSLITNSESRGDFYGFRCSMGGPKVTHLFFADDSLLFTKATLAECRNIKSLLEFYSQASGQIVNFNKSAVCFSRKIAWPEKRRLAAALDMSLVEVHERYLGLPCVTNRSKRVLFDDIKERVWKKLQNWGNRFFSGGGREVLIKAVVQSIPVYSMNLFRLPVSLICELHRLCARFWWGGNGAKRKMHWCTWDVLCKAHIRGGLGFRDLGAFNKAMLAKQCWRLLHNQDSLIARILKSCYFPESGFLEAKRCQSGSFMWNSLMWGKEVVEKGSRWRVGTSRSISVYKDRWIPRASTFKIASPPGVGVVTVADLKREDGSWNEELIRQTFWEDEVQSILGIPTSRLALDDFLLWHYEKSGRYSVKSGYWVALDASSNPSYSGMGCKESWWKFFWRLQLPNKIKLFIWKACNDWFPARANLARHGIQLDSLCPVPDALSFVDFVLSCYSSVSKLDFEILCVVWWRVWFRRNNLVHSAVLLPDSEVVEWASLFIQEFRAANVKVLKAVSVQSALPRWKAPPDGVFKINTDAALNEQGLVSGLGVVIRDCQGQVMASLCSQMGVCYSPEIAEALAIRRGLQLAVETGLVPAMLESDASVVVNAIGSQDRSSSDVGIIIHDISCLLRSPCFNSISFVPRLANKVAHGLAKLALRFVGESVWLEDCPLSVESLVLGDVPDSCMRFGSS